MTQRPGPLPTLRRMMTPVNPCLLAALALALVYHGGLLLSGTYKKTYDAYVHIFFADHYARNWFDPWDSRWYTGFTLTSYPPGSQQMIALLSRFVGLLTGFVIVQTFAVVFVTFGIYRFSKLWVSEEAAGYAALLTVFSSSIAETVHVFGQLPTMFSLGFLLNALPFVRRWLDDGKVGILLAAWALAAATTAGHHVTTLFGSVFFTGPVIASAIVDKFRRPLPDEPPGHPAWVQLRTLSPLLCRRLRRVLPVIIRAGIYGGGLLVVLVGVVLPYWLWSKSDPITQVPIPHASRDSFITNTNAGLVFWVIPYGVTLIALPYVVVKGLKTRAWPMTLSILLLFVLGTGGTTPIPRKLLGGAYDVLTLDRFTFWATILMLPLLGEFVVSLRHGGLARWLREQFGAFILNAVRAVLVVAFLCASMLTVNITQWQRFQPDAIQMQPILTFLQKDQHDRWRYLTLGFGDQMAWLSAQTTATTVDGDYHSARRLPELTTAPVERLEGAKFRGIPGIGSLQQFLAVPEKYNLKYVFSNDQFYDPLLFFSGWTRLERLDNGIVVWEREDIPPLPEVLPRRDIPVYQHVLWGTVPMAAIVTALIALAAPIWLPWFIALCGALGLVPIGRWIATRYVQLIAALWRPIDARLLQASQIVEQGAREAGPWQVWLRWAERIPRPKPASPTARHVHVALLVLALLGSGGGGYAWIDSRLHDPLATVRAYYDDLDFRRYDAAYARLDPQSRPAFDQFQLERSVQNGLLASYAKLDSVEPQIVARGPNRVEVTVEARYVTSLNDYPQTDHWTVVDRGGQWYLQQQPKDTTQPPDEFFRRPDVAWHVQGNRTVTTGPTAFADVLDRPELQILSARLVQVEGRYAVVGEVVNADVNPADLTVTALLLDDKGKTLTTYNAQEVTMHKLFPKEITPFRVDFEGVAGAAVSDLSGVGDFSPRAFTPVQLDSLVTHFQVYAKGVVTQSDLRRDVAAQDIQVDVDTGTISGQLINSGTQEATIPHLLITYYDADGRVAWVDDKYIDTAIQPQRTVPFDLAITPASGITPVLSDGGLFSNASPDSTLHGSADDERFPLPLGTGYASARISVHYFAASGP